MKLSAFFQLVQSCSPLPSVMRVEGTVFPALFFTSLIAMMRAHGNDVCTVSVGDREWSEVEALVSTSFLGQSQIMWLGDVTGLDAARLKKMHALLAHYNGPHTILVFLPCTEDEKEIKSIQTPSEKLLIDSFIERTELNALFSFFWKTTADRFITLVGADYKKMSLDSIMMIGHYVSVVGTHGKEFMNVWYPKLVSSEHSLFLLAQWFFARKKDLFFKQWHSIKNVYTLPFWTTFWSEQLWRAYYVISFRQEQRFNDAKQIGTRLPFFLQKDWQTVTLDELMCAHALLYEIDTYGKSGGEGCGLEVFYNSFLHTSFKPHR